MHARHTPHVPAYYSVWRRRRRCGVDDDGLTCVARARVRSRECGAVGSVPAAAAAAPGFASNFGSAGVGNACLPTSRATENRTRHSCLGLCFNDFY